MFVLLQNLQFHVWEISAVSVLALLCLFLYCLMIFNKNKAKEEKNQLINELENLGKNYTALEVERQLTQIENQILNEVYRQPTASRTLNALLKQFLHHSNEGYICYYRFQANEFVPARIRSAHHLQNYALPISKSIWDRMLKADYNLFKIHEMYDELGLSIPVQIQDLRLRELHTFTIKFEDEIVGVLVTSQLFKMELPPEKIVALTIKVLNNLSFKLMDMITTETYEQELQLTREMLSLRTLADQQYESSLSMIESFLKHLCQLADADRFALFLSTTDSYVTPQALLSGGKVFHKGVVQEWQEFEGRLASHLFMHSQPASLDQSFLRKLKIEKLIGSAVLIPLFQQNKPMGALCLTRSDAGHFINRQFELAKWAGGFLAETILRALTQAAVERDARMDSLTDLANRRTFDQMMEKELGQANPSGKECSLCLIDIDNFKKINDSYGHLVGDEVLKHIARILRDELMHMRATDRPLVARYGGEEFAILLPGMNMAGAQRILEGIRLTVEKSALLITGKSLRITISGGVATYPRHSQSITGIISLADKAMYQAKSQGKNQIVLASELVQDHPLITQDVAGIMLPKPKAISSN